jgi:hypothetical protein
MLYRRLLGSPRPNEVTLRRKFEHLDKMHSQRQHQYDSGFDEPIVFELLASKRRATACTFARYMCIARFMVHQYFLKPLAFDI